MSWNAVTEKVRSGRLVLLGVLGNKCSCVEGDCWHTGICRVGDTRCLHLDHINGDGFADRKRLGGPNSMIIYYAGHLEEAKRNLQVLCANCNWMKRNRNGEVRGRKDNHNSESVRVLTAKADLLRVVAYRLSTSPRYLELLNKYYGLRDHLIANTADTDVLNWLDSLGLQESTKRSLSDNLARVWEKSGKYGDDVDSIAELVRDRILCLETIIRTQKARTL